MKSFWGWFLGLAVVLFLTGVLFWTGKISERTAEAEIVGKTGRVLAEAKISPVQTEEALVGEEQCSESCLLEVDKRIAAAVATLSGVKEALPAATKRSVATATPAPRWTFLPLGGGGESRATDWSEVGGSEFSLDLSDYRAGARITWEANLKAQDANSQCYLRLYDKTNYRAVDYSHFATGEAAYVYFVSQPLSIWAGKNYYRLEMKSLNGVNCQVDSPRLVIRD